MEQFLGHRLAFLFPHRLQMLERLTYVEAVLWLGAKFAAAQFGAMAGLRDEAALLLLVAVGAVVYGGSILALFGPRWLRSLV